MNLLRALWHLLLAFFWFNAAAACVLVVLICAGYIVHGTIDFISFGWNLGWDLWHWFWSSINPKTGVTT